MEIITIQRYIHTSPRKLRLVVDMVKKMNPVEAISVLQITPQAAAKDLQKAISTVLANAKQQGVDVQKVNFLKIEINESMKMRRFRAGTRGRVRPYKKRMSHIKIVLTDEKVSQVEQVPQVSQGKDKSKEEKPRDTRDIVKTRGTSKEGALK